MNIFQRIINFFFPKKGKQITADITPPPVIPPSPVIEQIIEKPAEKKIEIPFVALKPKKWRVKNNRLHIVYNGTGKAGVNFSCTREEITNRIMKFTKQNKRYNGAIESMRCTKLKRAQEIVRGIQSHIISKAIFQDKSGKQIRIA